MSKRECGAPTSGRERKGANLEFDLDDEIGRAERKTGPQPSLASARHTPRTKSETAGRTIWDEAGRVSRICLLVFYEATRVFVSPISPHVNTQGPYDISVRAKVPPPIAT